MDENDVSAWGYFAPPIDPDYPGDRWVITGNNLNNTIAGGNEGGNDQLEGEGGDDILLIQRGDDTLIGSHIAGLDFLDDYDVALLADYEVLSSLIAGTSLVSDRNGYVIDADIPGTQTVIVLGQADDEYYDRASMLVGIRKSTGSSVGFSGFDGSNSKEDIDLNPALVDASRGHMTVYHIDEFRLSNISDVFYGNGLGHVISGRDGDDFLDGGAGADTLDGGNGIDTASYQRSTTKVSIVLDPSLNSIGLQSFGDAEGDRLINIENIIGSSFNDFLVADSHNNELHGQNGDDFLSGLVGQDQLYGGNGKDTLRGGDGFDGLYGGDGDDSLTGENGRDEIIGGDGIDTVRYDGNTGAVTAILSTAGGNPQRVLEHVGSNTGTAVATVAGITSIDQLANIENVVGSRYDDLISGDEGRNRLEGGNGADVISGAGNDDTILGGAKSDRLNGEAGNDLLDGGSDDDKLFGGANNDILRGGAGADILDGGADSDTVDYTDRTQSLVVKLTADVASIMSVDGVAEDSLVNIENVTGGSGADTITGDELANILKGNGNNDVLKGLGGFDVLDGGTGIDTASYQDKSLGIRVQLNAATTTFVLVNNVIEDRIVNIENIIGGRGDDTIGGDSLNNTISGGIGMDFLSGNIGDDILTGGTQNDTLFGGANNDKLDGNEGDDDLRGDDGDDTLTGGVGGDTLNGGDGIDTANYSASSARVIIDMLANSFSAGEAAGDTLTFIENLTGTQNSADRLTGNGEKNTIRALAGDDSLRGEGNDDILEGGTGADAINGGTGLDTVSYESSVNGVRVDLRASLQNGGLGDSVGDTLFFMEHIRGSSNADVLSGSDAANDIDGGAKNDLIIGHLGNDRLTGGTGFDQFGYTEADWGADTILDFTDGVDKLIFGGNLSPSFENFTISGNGTSSVMIRLNGQQSQEIILIGTGPITFDASDITFFN